MSKIPKMNQYSRKRFNRSKSLNNKNNEKYLELLESWNEVGASAKIYHSKHLCSVINVLTGHICEGIPKESILISRLSYYDEQIFEYYIDIINCYKSVIKSYKKISNNLKSDVTKDILNGILTVIYSRLKEYEDLNIASKNPISLEKKKIIDMYISKFSDEAYFLCESDVAVDNMGEDVLSFLYERFFVTLYTSYNRHLESCIKALDQMEARANLDTYQKLLKQEEDVFISIIKIQINELEKQKADAEELEELLYIIREAYQRLVKNLDNLESLQKEAITKTKSKNMTFENFENKLKDILVKEHKSIINSIKADKEKHEKSKNVFAESLEKNLSKAIEDALINSVESDIKTTLYSTKINNENFAKSMIDIFSNIINYSILNAPKLSAFETENKIIEGIAETLNIKVESIQESLNSFVEELSEVHEDIKLPESLCVEVLQLWQDEFFDTKNVGKKVETFFSTVIENNYETISTWFNKVQNLSVMAIEKKDFNYKKDNLLFEISTFEDLINYSISRLKDSEDMDIILYVQVVEEANSQINTMLLNNDIIPIAPEPHELFNAKEHDVIIAEKKEGFKKGEIIKVSNNGYKQGSKVILRANVIAAK